MICLSRFDKTRSDVIASVSDMIVPYVHYFSLLQSQRLFHDILSCKNCSSCATSKSHFSSNSIQPCGRLVCKQPHMAACLANVVVTCRGKRLEIAEMVCFKCFELTVAKSNCFLPVSPMMSYVHTQQEKLRKSAGLCP